MTLCRDIYTRGMRPLLPVLVVFALSASAQAAFVSSTYGVSVSAPSGWKQVSYPGVVVAFAAPVATEGFATNVNMTVESLPAGITLKQYVTAGQATLKRLITDFKPISSRSTTLGGQPAQEQTYSGRQGQFTLFISQTITIKSARAYVLTGTTVLDRKATLTAPMNTFVKSFKFTR